MLYINRGIRDVVFNGTCSVMFLILVLLVCVPFFLPVRM